MTYDGPTEFNNNDVEYLNWLAENPNGFVVNTPRGKPAANMKLHRATCATITDASRYRDGAFTERVYIKICSTNILDLRNWAHSYGCTEGLVGNECPICKPE